MSLSLFKCKMRRFTKTQRNPKRQKLKKSLRLRSTSKKNVPVPPVVASVARHVALTTSAANAAPVAQSEAIAEASRWCTKQGQRRPRATKRRTHPKS